MITENNQTSNDVTKQQIPPLVNPSPLFSNTSDISSRNGIVDKSKDDVDGSKILEIRLKYAEEIHQYIREYIRIADQKASFFFAISISITAYLNQQSYLTIWMYSPKNWTFIETLAFISSASILASIVACLLVVMPRLNGSKRGVIFFNAIVEYQTPQEYLSDVLTITPSKLCEEKLKHAYELAKVCNRKYNTLLWGLWSGALGVCSTALMLLTV